MLRLVQVSACWRKYLTQRDQQIRSELQLHGVLIDQRQEEQVIQLSLRGCTETIDYAAWRLSRPLVHNWSAVVTRWGGGTQMDPNFKDSARDSAIKRLVCYTVWHSSFNGFMAVQTQLGRFQNGTHLFFSSLSVRLRSGQKVRAEMISFIGFSSTGTRRTHGHLEGSFVSTWEPSAPCSFAGPS